MASNKTSKRTYKKRSTKKVMKGGDVCDIICPRDKNPEEEPVKEPEETEEEPVEELEEDEEVDVDEEPVEETEEAEEVEEESEEVEEEKPAEVNQDSKMFGFGGKKSRKNKSTKKLRKTAKKPKSAWTKFVTDLYKKKKMKNPIYMFKDALKVAAKIYRK